MSCCTECKSRIHFGFTDICPYWQGGKQPIPLPNGWDCGIKNYDPEWWFEQFTTPISEQDRKDIELLVELYAAKHANKGDAK